MATVAVYGAGMAGLSAAHELRKDPDLDVQVYESSDAIGGKSRNQYGGVLPGGTGGREDLPGEHGFRFFPGFYQNIIETMREIPVQPGGSVADRLVASPDAGMVSADKDLLPFSRSMEIERLGEVFTRLIEIYQELDFSNEDLARMAWFRIKYLTSCHTRRLGYDLMPWWEFIEGESPRYTEAFREFEASITRTMSALVARDSSALVVGDVTMQFLLGAFRDSEQDRLLDGPSDEAWLNPWQAHLTSSSGGSPVSFQFDTTLKEIRLAANGESVTSTLVEVAGNEQEIIADYHLVAIPVEQFEPLITQEMRLADPQFQALADHYSYDGWCGWMVGAQIGLKTDQPMVAGHVFYPASTWALTSVSQAQFWKNRGKLEDRFGDGVTTGMLSVILSDWDTFSLQFPAARSTASVNELTGLLAQQISYELQSSTVDLDASNIEFIHLDQGAYVDNFGTWQNDTPLLLHPVAAYDARPEVSGEIKNLFLASDFVKTDVKLATMEGACEAARKAVGELFRESDSIAIEPSYWLLDEPETVEPFKLLDEALEARGEDHIMDQFPLNLVLDAPGLVPFLPPVLEFLERIRRP